MKIRIPHITIPHFISNNHYAFVWLIPVLIFIACLIWFIANPGFRQKVMRFYKRRSRYVIGTSAAVLIIVLFFVIPKIRFYYDTRIVLPSFLSAQEKKQFIDRQQEVLSSKDHGKNNSGLYNDIGILRSGLKDYDGAVKSFKKAISKNPTDPRFWRNLAITYTNMDKYDLAELAFKQAFKLAPTQSEYWLELGQLYTFKIKDNEKARLFYLEAMSRNKNNASIAQAFAIFLEDVLKDYPEAITYWQIVLDGVPEKDKLTFQTHIAELKLRAGIK